MRRIKGIVYGVGAMGKLITKFMLEKGVEIVGAIGHTSNLGKDLGEVAGLGFSLNVKISNDADSVLSEQEADIAVLSVFAEMERTYPLLERCIENNLNVITTCDESLYPWTSCPELTAKIDRLAKRHNVTVVGAGFQDIFLVNQIIQLSGASHTIETINGFQMYNVDDYGRIVAEWHHVGETLDQFYKRRDKEGQDLSYFRMSLETIAAGLGLTVKRIEQTTEPIAEDIDIECKSLGMTIKRGLVIGRSQVTEIDTEHAVKLIGEEVSKVYKKGEKDQNKWSIRGVPDTYVENKEVATDVQTCTQIVNRIPDVINSEPGFITVDKLPMLRFRPFPLQYYLKR